MMTPKERAAMQQALEALENNLPFNYVANGRGELFPCFSNDPLRESNTREAITALREALKPNREGKYYYKDNACTADNADSPDCICWHDEALAEQAEQEPVAWALSHSIGLEFGSKYPIQETKEAAEQMARQHMGAVVVTPLYAAPVRTKDLTDDEIAALFQFDDYDFARAVIAADREKNK